MINTLVENAYSITVITKNIVTLTLTLSLLLSLLPSLLPSLSLSLPLSLSLSLTPPLPLHHHPQD